MPHVAIFHAGTDVRDGVLVAHGGRVLSVCATGPDVAAARASAYAAVEKITWPEGVFRTDIGVRTLAREQAA
jgi:phosphoribosylamine--glycine ligase